VVMTGSAPAILSLKWRWEWNERRHDVLRRCLPTANLYGLFCLDSYLRKSGCDLVVVKVAGMKAT